MQEAEPKPDPLAVGAIFAGRYLVEALLGQGGMGRVYRVFDRALDERIALKTLTVPERDEVALERFKREVRLARRITDRNVALHLSERSSSATKALTTSEQSFLSYPSSARRPQGSVQIQ